MEVKTITTSQRSINAALHRMTIPLPGFGMLSSAPIAKLSKLILEAVQNLLKRR